MNAKQCCQTNAATCSDELSANDRREIEDRLAQIAFHGQPAIAQRLAELDREWSAGRVAKVLIAVGILLGLAAAVFISLWWLILPVVLGLMLLQYIGGRECWLTNVLKRVGLRSGIEIEHERWALKALRGDFHNLPTVHDRHHADDLSRLEGEGGIVHEEPPALHEENRAAVKEVLERVGTHIP
jgi:hypothetical protein